MTIKRRRVRKFPVPRGFSGPAVSPYGAVLRLDVPHQKRRVAVATVSALAVHAMVFLLAIPGPPKPPPPKKEIPIITAQRPPPPPPPKPPPVPEPPKPPAQHTEARMPPRHNQRPPPPAAATKVVAVAADPNHPVETNFVMPEGTAEHTNGGLTSGLGTGTEYVPDQPVDVHAPPRKPTPTASQAKPPETSSTDWNCPWPEELRDSDMNDAWVTLKATIDANGDPRKVEIVHADKPLLADAARHCALDQAWIPALDDDGHRTTATTGVIAVHFNR